MTRQSQYMGGGTAYTQYCKDDIHGFRKTDGFSLLLYFIRPANFESQL